MLHSDVLLASQMKRLFHRFQMSYSCLPLSIINRGPYKSLRIKSEYQESIIKRKFCIRSTCADLTAARDVTPFVAPSIPATQAEYLQKLLLQKPDTPPDARVLKVAVVGCPNAGKSSLVNMLIKWRVCAVAGKAHTTRSKQLASLMQDNTQVVFVDLPGLVSGGKARRFNLEKSFIRDPHAAIFEADIIMIVVDVSHKRSREELDTEVVKALQFFEGKESILVLNKIDKSQNNPTRLLEVTRRLTRGIVNNRRSHLDAYMARFKRRAKMHPSSASLQPPSEVIATYLPIVCHEQANNLLEHLNTLRTQLNPPQFPNDPVALPNNSSAPISAQSIKGARFPDTLPLYDSVGDKRLITESERVSIDDYFSKYRPASSDHLTYSSTEPQLELNDKKCGFTGGNDFTSDEFVLQLSTSENMVKPDLQKLRQESDYFDSFMETLKQQLALNSASSAEVADRRKRWLEVTIAVKGITDWPGFSEVFMVSSANGDGVDSLRDYLLSKAIPNRPWMMSPLLVTEQEPSELVRMCVWAHCLDRLREEVPYALKIIVDDCERSRFFDDGDDRIFVHVRLQCRTERHLRMVLGLGGSTIKEIAGAVKMELMTLFRADTIVKLTAELDRVNPLALRKLKKAKNFADVLPEVDRVQS